MWQLLACSIACRAVRFNSASSNSFSIGATRSQPSRLAVRLEPTFTDKPPEQTACWQLRGWPPRRSGPLVERQACRTNVESGVRLCERRIPCKVWSSPPRSTFDVSKARLILVTLICASPAILLRDGLTMQGLVAGIVAVALAITARTLRPGQADFLLSVVRPLAPVAAVPALWVLIQVLPLRALAHPIWKSVGDSARTFGGRQN